MAANQKKLRIEGDMTIYRAVELKQTLVDALHSQRQLEIDLSGVTEMDSAGFQLLLLVKREAQDAGKSVRFVGHSPACIEVIDAFSMAAAFGDQLVIPAAAGGSAN
jgi:anti-sigma B factor antagonist